MAKAIYETRDKQLIPLDNIQHINARYNDALKDEHQTLTWNEDYHSCERVRMVKECVGSEIEWKVA